MCCRWNVSSLPLLQLLTGADCWRFPLSPSATLLSDPLICIRFLPISPVFSISPQVCLLLKFSHFPPCKNPIDSSLSFLLHSSSIFHSLPSNLFLLFIHASLVSPLFLSLPCMFSHYSLSFPLSLFVFVIINFFSFSNNVLPLRQGAPTLSPLFLSPPHFSSQTPHSHVQPFLLPYSPLLFLPITPLPLPSDSLIRTFIPVPGGWSVSLPTICLSYPFHPPLWPHFFLS